MRGRSLLYVFLGVVVVATGIAYARSAKASGSASKQVPGKAPSPLPPVPEPEPAPSGATGKRVLLVGDSLAVGLTDRLTKRAAQDGGLLRASAKVGTTAVQWSKGRFEQALDAEKPDLVLVCLGTNDAVSADVSAAEVAVRRLQEQADLRGIPVFWIGMPTMPPRIAGAEAMRQATRGIARQYFSSEQLQFERAPDKIHATPRGYATWADAVWAWLKQVQP